MKPELPHYPTATPVQMPAQGILPPAVHRFHPDTVAALHMAEVTGRPLLLRGLPGVGKSQTARAAAFAAGRPLLTQMIDGRTEPHDLMWRFDQVSRLADAQVLKDGQELRAESHYLSPQNLWWAFDWAGLAKEGHPQPVQTPKKWQAGQHRAVLLIDEIDKADPELPNALLEVLSSNGFGVPLTGQKVQCEAHNRPLIVITTNEERELPQPFLRRCLVHRLELANDETALTNELQLIGAEHQAWLVQSGLRSAAGTCLIVNEVAACVAEERISRLVGHDYLPGTSEFLDLVTALAELWPGDEAAQRLQLKTLQKFVFSKSAR